jgi:hypothetical protein
MKHAPAILLAAATLVAAGSARAEPGADAAQTYRIVTQGSTVEVKAGGSGRIVIALEATGKVHVHPEAPLKVTLTSTGGLQLAKEKLGHADAVDPKAEMPRFEVPFVARGKGKQEAKAKLDFFLCSDAWCAKQVRDVTVAVDVR